MTHVGPNIYGKLSHFSNVIFNTRLKMTEFRPKNTIQNKMYRAINFRHAIDRQLNRLFKHNI